MGGTLFGVLFCCRYYKQFVDKYVENFLVDKKEKKWYNNITVERTESAKEDLTLGKVFLKKFEKALDKRKEQWYNIKAALRAANNKETWKTFLKKAWQEFWVMV